MSDDEHQEELEEEDEYGDEYGDTMDSSSIGRAARCTFGVKWSQTAYISKLHSKASPGIGTPGVGDYKLAKGIGKKGEGSHFGTATKDRLPTRYEGPAGSKSMPAHNSPGPKYNAMPTEYRAVPSWKIGTSTRPPLSTPSRGPGPGAYSPEKPPSTAPPEFTFGESPEQDRFATNMFMGHLASKAIPVVDTPGPVYQLRHGLSESAAPFDHADRFEPLKHLMISDEHNKRMGEKAGEAPSPNKYYVSTFPQPEHKAVRRNPPTMKPARQGVYTAGEGSRFTTAIYAGAGAQVGLGKDGGGPGSADVKDVTLKKNAPKFPRSQRQIGSKSSVSQVPGPGAYKPPLNNKVGCNYQGKGIAMGLNRTPKTEMQKTPAPNTYNLVEEMGKDRPKRGIGKGPRSPKVYLSKKHTQDVKGLDSPGPVYHYQQDKDFGTGHTTLIGTSDRNKSEAKRFISKLHSADVLGVGTPGPGQYGSHAEERGTGGFSFGTAERKSMASGSSRTPGPGSYVKPSTLRKGGCSFGGGPSRC